MATLTTRSRGTDPDVSEWVDESPLAIIAGESVTLQLTWLGASSVSSTSEIVYRASTGADVSSTHMPAGASSASGNVQTAKPLTALVGGVPLVVVFQATVDGNTERRKCLVRAKRAQEG